VKEENLNETYSEIVLAILKYLVDHPRSGDTVEGIERWWLLEHYILGQRRLVREALAFLVRHELVLEVQQEDLRKRYRLNPDRWSEARTMVETWRTGHSTAEE